MGLTLDELMVLEYGVVMDMMTEMSNDECNYKEVATQEDINAFLRS